MDRNERLTCVAGAVTAAVSAYALLAWIVGLGVPWVAALIGGLVGAFYGACGQSFIEGLVICAMCAIGVTVPLAIFSHHLPWWVSEPYVGLAAGAALGNLCHGCGEFLPDPRSQSADERAAGGGSQ